MQSAHDALATLKSASGGKKDYLYDLPWYLLIGPPGSGKTTALIYTADDEIFEPAWERFMATELLRIHPVELPGGHFPMLERTEAVAGILDRLARRG